MASRFVVITGVSHGLGHAMTEKFISLGHQVAGCARSAKNIASLQKKFAAPHEFEAVDISEATMVNAWAETILQRGVPDLLINNAAIINRNSPLWKISEEEMAAVIKINVLG